MKRFFALFLALVLFCSIITGASVSVSALSSGGYEYEILDDGNISILGYTGNYSKLNIPSSINGRIVTAINGYAFSENFNITSVTIPETVTSIGYGAFSMCDNLKSITVPKTVTHIEGYAFHYTPWYDAKPDGLVYFGTVLYDYKGNMPKNYTLNVKSGTTMISGSAFMNMNNLVSVTMPDSVIYLDDYVFEDCTSLSNINFSDNIEYVGESVFLNTKWEKNLPDGPVYVGKVLYAYNGDVPQPHKYVIKDGTTQIYREVFYECDSLFDITIPDTVKRIGYKAFYLSWIDEIKLPGSLEVLEDYAIASCGVDELILPPSLKKIGEFAIAGNYYTTITLPKSVEYLGGAAFLYCDELTSVTILNPDCYIGYALFHDTIPQNVTIYGYDNSTAEEYAKENGNKFVSLGKAPGIDTPKISKAEVNNNGIKLYWDKVEGAEKYNYRIFMKSGSSWKTIDTVSANENSYIHKDVVVGTTYTYTVRCVDANNNFVSDYDKTGYTVRFLEMPEIVSFENISGGTVIKWSSVENAQKYRLYVKNSSGWTKLVDTASTSYTHMGLKNNTTYTYTVRCISDDLKTLESRYSSGGYSNVYKGAEVLLGDADDDGEVSVMDASLIQMYLVGKQEIIGDALRAADADKDGDVSVMDASLIQMFLVGKIEIK
ncbi:MAG: leucine-rich repeat protein [Ruminococcus sp.]|nr:leucine-rich repeat protein [Ruminococcus sp.]